MKKLYCIKCKKYRKFKKPKIYIFDETFFALNAIIMMKKYSKKKNQLR